MRSILLWTRIPIVIIIVLFYLQAVNKKYKMLQKTNSDVEETNFEELMEGINGKTIAQDDPRLIKYVRDNILLPPSKKPYNLKYPNSRDRAYESESETILSLLEMTGGERTNGFFIEAGAADGETTSTTIMFERYLNWTGLLVESDPVAFNKMKTKNRKSWISNAPLSTKPYPEKVNITQEMYTGKGKGNTFMWNMQAIPLWTFLLAINQTEIDFLCLDVELLTQAVFKTLPLDKVNIKVAMIEIVNESDKGKEEMKKYLQNNDFTFYKYHRTQYYNRDNRINDIIVYKNKSEMFFWRLLKMF